MNNYSTKFKQNQSQLDFFNLQFTHFNLQFIQVNDGSKSNSLWKSGYAGAGAGASGAGASGPYYSTGSDSFQPLTGIGGYQQTGMELILYNFERIL